MPFTHKEHLQHLLKPEHYASEKHYRLELERLFWPAWHPIATVDELSEPGSFLTFDLMDTPILIRNFDGELRAFLNVCAHRHSVLTSLAKGKTERLQCQYHGWEYGEDGRTRTIPDAKSFRPWDRENSCLRSFRLETCADLIFINMGNDALPLREWLAPVWDRWQEFGGDYEHIATWENDFACNWKVVFENSLESYHVPMIHQTTFKEFPSSANAWHELEDSFTSYETFMRPDNDEILVKMGLKPKHEYWHWAFHPSTTGSTLDGIRMMQCVFPTGPRSCRYRSMLFTFRGNGSGRAFAATRREMQKQALAFSHTIFDEDATIYEAVQRGLEVSPHRGVIGTREERVFYFQKYVLDHCGLDYDLLPIGDEGPVAEAQPSS